MSSRLGVYAGSFDPLSNGHVWVIEQAASLFDELIVAIGENPMKTYTFSVKQRLDMLEHSLADLKRKIPTCSIKIDYFSNQYLINYAKQIGASFMVRGIRNINDFEFERTMRHINSDISNKADITTIFLIPPRELGELSSSFVKNLCGPHGWQEQVKKFVPIPVYECLLHKFDQSR